MRARLLKPGFFLNEDLAKLPLAGRLLFIGLWCLADREGRLENRPVRIKAAVFPYNGEIEIDALLDQLADSGLIARYEVNGTACIHIPTFLKHQHPHPRESESTLPAKPGTGQGSSKDTPGSVQGQSKVAGIGSPRYRVSSVTRSPEVSSDPPLSPPEGGQAHPSEIRRVSLKAQDSKASKPWERVLAELQPQITKPNYETWLKETVGFAFEEDRLVILAPNEFAVEWLSTKLRPLIAKAVSELAGKPMEIEFVLAEDPCTP